MNDDKFNNKSHNALISEIRRMKKELQENKAFKFRDVREYLGDNIDWNVIEPAL